MQKKDESQKSTFKGNFGNLLQHWTLVEIVVLLKDLFPSQRLTYFDAHSMSPYAHAERPDAHFLNIFLKLCTGTSKYENVWCELRSTQSEISYPNSIAFVQAIWKNDILPILCEINPETYKQLAKYVSGISDKFDVKRRIVNSDWRKEWKAQSFDDSEVILASFDPNKFLKIDKSQGSFNLTDNDVKSIIEKAKSISKTPLVIQISIFGNSDDDCNHIKQAFIDNGFVCEMIDYCWLYPKMHSLVICKNVSGIDMKISQLNRKFKTWIER